MANTIGTATQRDTSKATLARAKLRAALLPDLLVEAQRLSHTVISGWHGRRKRGIGDNFWQFRPYVSGENLTRIDWRRSARDQHLYIRDQEWEAAHTVWVWSDASPSMLYQSANATVSKQSRALVLALAVCDVLARSGERIGWPGIGKPVSHRNSSERMAANLSHSNDTASWPVTHNIHQHNDLVVISDFLDPIDQTLARIDQLAHRGVRGHLVQIIDPAEEAFPYAGRTEFHDPEDGSRMIAGQAQNYREEYQKLFSARKNMLTSHTTRLGWSHTVHHTDAPASQALVALHARLSAGSAVNDWRAA